MTHQPRALSTPLPFLQMRKRARLPVYGVVVTTATIPKRREPRMSATTSPSSPRRTLPLARALVMASYSTSRIHWIQNASMSSLITALPIGTQRHSITKVQRSCSPTNGAVAAAQDAVHLILWIGAPMRFTTSWTESSSTEATSKSLRPSASMRTV